MDQDSGKVYCGCSGASVYLVPNSALPGPPSGTTGGTSGGGTTTGGTTTGITGGTSGGTLGGTLGGTSGGGITTTTTQGEVKVYNQCEVGITAYIGNTIVYVGPKQSVSVITSLPAPYTLISQNGQNLGQGTASGGGTVSPRDCPSVASVTPSSTTPSASSSLPWGILLLIVILGAIALGGDRSS